MYLTNEIVNLKVETHFLFTTSLFILYLVDDIHFGI